jgi:hypothetical protein
MIRKTTTCSKKTKGRQKKPEQRFMKELMLQVEKISGGGGGT